MLTALKYKDRILEEFYLDRDDMTIRRNKNGYQKRFVKHDVVEPFTLKSCGREEYNYRGIHIPRTRTTLSVPWLLTILRGIPFKNGDIVDHIDGNVSNNCRENLRVTTQRANCKNRKMRKDNTSGFTGICFNAQANLYIIRRSINGKRIYHSSKTFEGALDHLRNLKQKGLADGYLKRHGEKVQRLSKREVA